MKKLRWAMDGGFWDVDVSTPRSLDGVARPVGGHPLLPLGLSRGTKLSRPKQIDFMQRFMTLPFVPSYAAPALGFTLQRVLTFPFSDSWFAALLGQFNVQKFVSSIKKSGLKHPSDSSSWLRTTRRHLLDESLYALGFCSELLLTPDDTLLLSLETDATHHSPRKKAVLQHQFPHHNLIVEVASAGLFIDRHSAYWDLPLSIAIDLASIGSDSGLSYHLCLHQNVGTPKQYQGDQRCGVPGALQSGSCVKTAFSFKRNIDIWRSTAHKLKMVQPFDVFLSSPHISASGVIGAVASASVGNNSVTSLVEDRFKALEGYSLHDQGLKSAFSTDIFASLSFTAQHGNFQRLFSDLTRIYTQLDFPSGLKFLSGISHVARDVYNCQQPRMEAVQTICPSAFISLQQQIVGPFSFRVDSAVTMDWKTRKWCIKVDEPVFAIEYALQVLGSAKAVAWYSVKHQEFMVELRFFEK